MQHLDEGTIHAWLDGALAPPEAEQVAKHAAECATCAAAVAEARGIIAGSARIVAALDDVPGGVIPGNGPAASGSSTWRRLRLTPARAALAATILLAVSTTLTLRSSSKPQSKSDSLVTIAEPRTAAPATAPVAALDAANKDSTKPPAPSTVNVILPRKTSVATNAPQAKPVAEQRALADAAAPRDTAQHELAKTRVAAQAVAAGASAAAPPAAAPSPMLARGNVTAARMLDRRADSVLSPSAFEGCYRLTADSASGSTEIPRGLPAKFTLSRPSADGLAARRAFAGVADSTPAPVAWRPLSPTQARVTFAAGGGSDASHPVSLVLTTGSPIAVASSGIQTTSVRVARSSCPP